MLIQQAYVKDTMRLNSIDSTILWHKQMGHISGKGLCAMYDKGLVKGLLDCFEKLYFCECCIYGKQSYLSFSLEVTRAMKILD